MTFPNEHAAKVVDRKSHQSLWLVGWCESQRWGLIDKSIDRLCSSIIHWHGHGHVGKCDFVLAGRSNEIRTSLIFTVSLSWSVSSWSHPLVSFKVILTHVNFVSVTRFGAEIGYHCCDDATGVRMSLDMPFASRELGYDNENWLSSFCQPVITAHKKWPAPKITIFHQRSPLLTW